MKKTHVMFAFFAIGAILMTTGFIAAQENPEPKETKEAPADALLGIWTLQVDAGEEVYALTLTLKKGEGPLAGTVSEISGWFTDIPLTDLAWDGTTLKFQAMTVTPPDGVDRPWFVEMKLVETGLAGTLSLPDMGMILPVAGTRTSSAL